ncbi:GNAT family N-acetyltransferase [Phocaeicola plebeius]|uniref:GNAT family N-acetyltransferase n=1 Tax=Phocaeicola plebeius TaxID=310297 RepID=UPI0039930B61
MFTIKKATLADIEVIRTLAAQTFPATYQHILTPEQIDYMIDWMYSSESLRNHMEKEHHIYYIAYEECEPAGYVSIQQEDTDLFHLQKIYVLPYFQKYKLGRQLFQQAIKGIKELHPEPCRMELNVNRQNPALGFYEHMGMKKVREGDFPIGNGYYMNDYIMGMDI